VPTVKVLIYNVMISGTYMRTSNKGITTVTREQKILINLTSLTSAKVSARKRRNKQENRQVFHMYGI